ncbi:MAG: hypothetical protein SWK90_01510 [Chloroflexota bacterium]|nr:hypothetical protein [Chloroflexota bacterium]
MDRKWILATVLALALLAVTATVALSWSAVDPVTGAGPDFMVSLPLDDQADSSVAYNSDDDEYLVVWGDDRGDNADIYGQVFSASGIPQDDNFVVSNAADEQNGPYVAYNSTDHNYVVVWGDKRGGLDYDVYGQVVGADGTLSGNNFVVNGDASDQVPGDVIYDPNANHYLVVYVDDGDNRVEGQMLNPTGGLLAPNAFGISGGGGDRPRVAYNSHRNSYMAVYQQGADIYGQAVAADGSLSDPAFAICDDAADQTTPNVEFNSNSSVYEYLVVWGDERDSNWDIYGQRIDEDGNPQGGEIVISAAADDQYSPDVAYNERVNQWLVAWHDYRNQGASGADIYAQRVRGADGSLAGQGNFIIYDGPHNQRSVALAARPSLLGAEYLAVWGDQRSDDGQEVVGQRIGALLGTLNWHDFNISAPLESQENPRVAYNSTDQQFLVAWQDERDGDSDIYAQIVLTTGIPITGNVVVQDEAHQLVDPAVAYSPIGNTYVVVWHDEDDGDIEERVVNADGTLGVGVFNVIVAGTHPAIAYNSAADEYLVVFTSGGDDISGRRVATDGTFLGAAFSISSDAAAQSLPQVAYNGADDEYLVVWSDERTDGADVYGRRVDADGTPLGDDFAIATGTDAQDVPSVAWNSDDNEYLVAWHDYRDSGTTGSDIYGQLVGQAGSLEGGNFRISSSTALDYQQFPRAMYFSAYERYFVTWQDDRNGDTGWDIYGQNVNADGSLYLSNVPFFVFTGWQQRPDGVFSTEANRGLTVWQDGRNGTTLKIYGRIKEPRFAIYLPLVLRNY